jgi:hypothetical protein
MYRFEQLLEGCVFGCSRIILKSGKEEEIEK